MHNIELSIPDYNHIGASTPQSKHRHMYMYMYTTLALSPHTLHNPHTIQEKSVDRQSGGPSVYPTRHTLPYICHCNGKLVLLAPILYILFISPMILCGGCTWDCLRK